MGKYTCNTNSDKNWLMLFTFSAETWNWLIDIKKRFILVSQQTELWPLACTHRVISDKVHRLLVTLSYFRPDRFVQLFFSIHSEQSSFNKMQQKSTKTNWSTSTEESDASKSFSGFRKLLIELMHYLERYTNTLLIIGFKNSRYDINFIK